MEFDRDISVPAKAIGDPARARMVRALLGGIALPAGELAHAAGVAPSTASEHLKLLLEAGLVQAEGVGRHRYYRLAGDGVAHAVEALQAISPSIPVRSPHQHRVADDLRAGRRCYDHLAGDLGLRVTDILVGAGILAPLPLSGGLRPPDEFPDHPAVRVFRIDYVHTNSRRPWARGCLDWTGRRPHVAGTLGQHLLDLFRSSGWVTGVRDSRALRLTDSGAAVLRDLEAA